MKNFAVQAIDLTKNFGGTFAVKNVSLEIEEGEFFSFLGPSGCGKTTLLRMIAGFEHPTSGQLLVGGQDVKGLPAHKRPVNMVFQSYALFPHMSVLENIAFGLLQSKSCSKADAHRKAKEALEMVRLSAMAERFPSQLSGGQQQRIALARAIVKQPKVLLLDEPLSALDPQIREEMQFELSRLQKRLGLTFVMVTHDQTEALALSSRVAVFLNGNLEQVGTPSAIYDAPQTVFVAKFIGHSNLLEGQLGEDRADGLVSVKLVSAQSQNTVRFSVRKNESCAVSAGTPVTIWIKPNHISLDRFSGSAESYSSLTGQSFHGIVQACTYQGPTTEFKVLISGTDKVLTCIQTTEYSASDSALQVGSEVDVTVSAHRCSYVGKQVELNAAVPVVV